MKVGKNLPVWIWAKIEAKKEIIHANYIKHNQHTVKFRAPARGRPVRRNCYAVAREVMLTTEMEIVASAKGSPITFPMLNPRRGAPYCALEFSIFLSDGE